MLQRLPRFKRSPAVAPIQVTKRDREIIRLVHLHRFLRSAQIVVLLNDSSQQLLRRLQLLYHHGYLERPRAQLDYYNHGGSRHIVYGVGNKGAALSKREQEMTHSKVQWGEKNRSIGKVFLEHALLVSDIMVALELSCRKVGGIRLLTERELTGRDKRLFRWKVNINGRKLGVIPDRVFALEFSLTSGEYDRAYFFLEADRGTMPVTRRNLLQTSFFRKLLAYEATWSQSIHRTRFGFHRFRVLTVTTSAERVRSLVNACSQLERGHGLFLFADRTALEKPCDIFSPIWQTGRQGETTGLLN